MSDEPAQGSSSSGPPSGVGAPPPPPFPFPPGDEVLVEDQDRSIKRRVVRKFALMRAAHAYFATLRIVVSYLWLRALSYVVSPDRMARKVARNHVRCAVRLRLLIEDLRGLFIKIGQMVSILANFLPEEFRQELEGLQDRVPPRPFDEIARVIEEQIGQPVSGLFRKIEERAVAAASLGQVHRAELPGGRRVAVKVQYPQVESLVQTDLRILRGMLRIVAFFFPQQGLMNIYHEVREILYEELDFKQERINLESVAGRFTGDPTIFFPEAIDGYCTRKVLTTGWIDGVKITHIEALDAVGMDRRRLAENLVHLYCKQIFLHGEYHADPHPGNVLVLGDGRIALVDFGAVSRVSERMRAGMVDYLQAALTENTTRLVEALRKMGFVAAGVDSDRFEELVGYFQRKVSEHIRVDSFDLNDIRVDPSVGMEVLRDLRRMQVGLRDLGEMFRVPREWILLERTVILLTGICTLLEPDIKPMDLIRPYLEVFVLGDERDWQSFLVDGGRDWLVQLVALPAEMRKVLSRAAAGKTRVRLVEARDLSRAMGLSARLVSYGILTAGLLVAGSLERAQPDGGLGSTFHVLALVSGLLFLGALLGLKRRTR